MSACKRHGRRYASGSSVLAIAFAAHARTSCPGGSGPPRQAAGAIHGASSSLFARRLPRSSNPPFAIYRLGSRSPASGSTCSTVPSPSFVLPPRSALRGTFLIRALYIARSVPPRNAGPPSVPPRRLAAPDLPAAAPSVQDVHCVHDRCWLNGCNEPPGGVATSRSRRNRRCIARRATSGVPPPGRRSR
jgi:hypothetical protein